MDLLTGVCETTGVNVKTSSIELGIIKRCDQKGKRKL